MFQPSFPTSPPPAPQRPGGNMHITAHNVLFPSKKKKETFRLEKDKGMPGSLFKAGRKLAWESEISSQISFPY